MEISDIERSWIEDKFIKDNYKLVFTAIKLLRRNPKDPDVVQCGRIAMLEAYRSYDPSRSKFSTYYVTYLKNALYIQARETYKVKSKEITNFRFGAGEDTVYNDFDLFQGESFYVEDLLNYIEDKELVEKIMPCLTQDERDILIEICCDGNSLRNGVSDITDGERTEKIYRRRNRSYHRALTKARGIAGVQWNEMTPETKGEQWTGKG